MTEWVAILAAVAFSVITAAAMRTVYKCFKE